MAYFSPGRWTSNSGSKGLRFVQWSSKHPKLDCQVPIAKDEAPNCESSLRDFRIAFRMVLLPRCTKIHGILFAYSMASNELHDWVHCKEIIHTFGGLGLEFKILCCFCSRQTGKIKLMEMFSGLFSGEELFWMFWNQSEISQLVNNDVIYIYIYISIYIYDMIYMYIYT